MHNTERFSGLSAIRQKWAVAELKVSFKATKKTNVFVHKAWDAAGIVRAMVKPATLESTEQLHLIFLDDANEVIAFKTLNYRMREIFKEQLNEVTALALACRAKKVVMAHNHPHLAGVFSRLDITISELISHRLNLFAIKLLDHVLITVYGHTSLTLIGYGLGDKNVDSLYK